MIFFRVGDYQRRPGPYAHMHWAVCGQRARPAEAALARAGWTGVYRTRVILRGGEGVNPFPAVVPYRGVAKPGPDPPNGPAQTKLS